MVTLRAVTTALAGDGTSLGNSAGPVTMALVGELAGSNLPGVSMKLELSRRSVPLKRNFNIFFEKLRVTPGLLLCS